MVKLLHGLKFLMEDVLYVYIIWLLELFTLRKEKYAHQDWPVFVSFHQDWPVFVRPNMQY